MIDEVRVDVGPDEGRGAASGGRGEVEVDEGGGEGFEVGGCVGPGWGVGV